MQDENVVVPEAIADFPVPEQEPEQVAPAQDAPQAETPEVQQEVSEEASTTSEVAETPSTQSEQPIEDDEADYPQYQSTEIDLNALPRDPENPEYVDPQAYAQALQQQAREAARQEFMEQRREEKLWEKAQEAYPELKTNKELRDLVHNSRMGEFVVGKNPSPKQVADRLFKYLNVAKADGAKQAQSNVVVQESARLETSSTRSNENSVDRSSLLGKVSSYNSQERDSAVDMLLKDMFDSGDLKLPQ